MRRARRGSWWVGGFGAEEGPIKGLAKQMWVQGACCRGWLLATLTVNTTTHTLERGY